MARFTIKALAVVALVCLVFDRSHAQQQGLGQQGMDMMKDKMNDLLKSFANSQAQQGLNQPAIGQNIGQGIGQVIGQQGLDAAKQKINDFMSSFKQNAPSTPNSQSQPLPQQQPQPQPQGVASGIEDGFKQVIGQQFPNLAKDKVNELMNSFRQSASEQLNKMQGAVKEPENTKKVQQEVTNFFSGAFSKLKNAFGSKNTNPDDQIKQEAVKAFDDYAVKNSNPKPQL